MPEMSLKRASKIMVLMKFNIPGLHSLSTAGVVPQHFL